MAVAASRKEWAAARLSRARAADGPASASAMGASRTRDSGARAPSPVSGPAPGEAPASGQCVTR